MYRFSTSLLVTVTLLSGCGSSKDDTLSAHEIEALFNAPMVPVSTAITAMLTFPLMAMLGGDDGCPVVTQSDAGTVSVVGDCTTETGVTWSGSMSWEGADITWNGFGMPGLQVDGTQTISTSDLVSNITVTTEGRTTVGTESGVTTTAGFGSGSHTMVYTDYTVTNFWGFYVAALSEEPYSIAVSGDASIDDLGDFTITGSIEDDWACEEEPAIGALTLDGPFTFEIAFDGWSGCDGCVDWTSGDQSGSECYEGGDTGGAGDTGG